MSASLLVFKLSVQSVCQLQHHRIKVSFKITDLPYQPYTLDVIWIKSSHMSKQCLLLQIL